MFHNLNTQTTLDNLLKNKIPLIKPRGLVIEVYLNTSMTKFDIIKSIKLTQKTRKSQKLVAKNKTLLQYTMVGRCIFFRKRGINASFTLRNVMTLSAYEMTYPLFSPIIQNYVIRNGRTSFYTKQSLLTYRKKSAAKSRVNFDYVIQTYIYIND